LNLLVIAFQIIKVNLFLYLTSYIENFCPADHSITIFHDPGIPFFGILVVRIPDSIIDFRNKDVLVNISEVGCQHMNNWECS